jgi:hypothetical protein
MYSRFLIGSIVITFLLLVTFPFWYGRIISGAGAPPRLEFPRGEGQKQCIESAAYMRKHHVEILNRWKDMAVREGNHRYVASDGKEYVIGLTGTCMSCHSSKAAFCDRCHTYVRIAPRCWDCHYVQKKEGA